MHHIYHCNWTQKIHSLVIVGTCDAWHLLNRVLLAVTQPVILYCRMTNYELLRWLVETLSRDIHHYRMLVTFDVMSDYWLCGALQGPKNVHCSPADGMSRVPHYKNGVSDIRIHAVPDDIFFPEKWVYLSNSTWQFYLRYLLLPVIKNVCAKIPKNNKNEFLCLGNDFIALTTSSYTKSCIFLQKKCWDTRKWSRLGLWFCYLAHLLYSWPLEIVEWSWLVATKHICTEWKPLRPVLKSESNLLMHVQHKRLFILTVNFFVSVSVPSFCFMHSVYWKWLHCDVLVITLYVINCCSSIMDASNGCQDLFTDMDYMSCPSCIALQQVILCLYGT